MLNLQPIVDINTSDDSDEICNANVRGIGRSRVQGRVAHRGGHRCKRSVTGHIYICVSQ